MNWTGYIIDDAAATIHRIESDYVKSESVRDNARRCYEEQTGLPSYAIPDGRIYVVRTESPAGERIDEDIEIVAIDQVGDDLDATQGYRIGPAIVIAPPPPDVLETALKSSGLGKTGRALMDAIAAEGYEDPEVLAAEFAEFVKRMAA